MVLACILALLLLANSLPATPTIRAAPAQRIILDATQDTYTDINRPATNRDGWLLTAANSPGPPEEPDVTTKAIFLAFDLSGLGFQIKSAVLSLSTLTCDGLVPVDAVDVTVYGVDNAATWAEETLTWDSQPEISTTALASLDAGGTIYDRSQTYTWTDTRQGDFATWLESQRGANDGSATLVLAIKKADDPGLADVYFEDREGTGAAYGCADSLGGPTLEVSSFKGGYGIYLPLVVRNKSSQ
jgi:hypothetical protein